MQTPTARLNGSVGASLAVLFGLMFEDTAAYAFRQTPTARLNGSVGASFALLLFGLTFDDTAARPFSSVRH
jgi:hypothetical protein